MMSFENFKVRNCCKGMCRDGNIKASDGHKISRTQPSLCHPSGNPLTLITYPRRVIYSKKSVDESVSPNHWKLSLNKSHHRRFLNSWKRHTSPHWSNVTYEHHMSQIMWPRDIHWLRLTEPWIYPRGLNTSPYNKSNSISLDPSIALR